MPIQDGETTVDIAIVEHNVLCTTIGGVEINRRPDGRLQRTGHKMRVVGGEEPPIVSIRAGWGRRIRESDFGDQEDRFHHFDTVGPGHIANRSEHSVSCGLDPRGEFHRTEVGRAKSRSWRAYSEIGSAQPFESYIKAQPVPPGPHRARLVLCIGAEVRLFLAGHWKGDLRSRATIATRSFRDPDA